MSYKNAASTTITRDLLQYEKGTGNIYESLVVIAKRANHISSELKEELQNKLSEFTASTDNLEEVFENREQIEISKFYERLPKPVLIALQEYLDGKIYHRNPAKEQ
ncbi:MAG: DNA-directed RNA polymerase subunit omega [Bacteroidetes bacterium]|nr:DNA-directed RNA polymerase subunit omega [Bacteroidota bacterium]MBK7970185.1 DNA-directed RNA polymerase subunit omega [Bacteroidota bacterium]MBK8414214.1 DNA-directed RNA polymerase subunit omega [Bacteroidota bacterium]MBK8874122.1 DNA-directed RNA polymerase subunit omega [Bacteroidota bacterium]MBK9048338.1 DNA-directed RNA polymerase subunit omega [Bacteroidota bacterium]